MMRVREGLSQTSLSGGKIKTLMNDDDKITENSLGQG
jgi:hypothetical protein